MENVMENKTFMETYIEKNMANVIACSTHHLDNAIEGRIILFAKYTKDVIDDSIRCLNIAILRRVESVREDRLVGFGKRKVNIPAKVFGIEHDPNGAARIVQICQVYSEIIIPRLTAMNCDKVENRGSNRLLMPEIFAGAKDGENAVTDYNIILFSKSYLKRLKSLIRKSQCRRAVIYPAAGGRKAAWVKKRLGYLRETFYRLLKIVLGMASERSRIAIFVDCEFAMQEARSSPLEVISDQIYSLTKTQKSLCRNEYSSWPCTISLAL